MQTNENKTVRTPSTEKWPDKYLQLTNVTKLYIIQLTLKCVSKIFQKITVEKIPTIEVSRPRHCS